MVIMLLCIFLLMEIITTVVSNAPHLMPESTTVLAYHIPQISDYCYYFIQSFLVTS